MAGNGIRYSDVEVRLVGEDGNAFAILGRVQRALRSAGVDESEISEFFAQASSGDYDHLLGVVMQWVDVA